MIGVFKTDVMASSKGALEEAMFLAFDDGREIKASDGYILASPESAKITLMTYFRESDGASRHMSPLMPSQSAASIWTWLGAGDGHKAFHLTSSRCGYDGACSVTRLDADSDVKFKAEITGTGQQRLKNALDLCFNRAKHAEPPLGQAGMPRGLSFWNIQNTRDDVENSLIRSSIKESVISFSSVAEGGHLPLPASLNAFTVSGIVMAWIENDHKHWPREPDTDGFCEKGWSLFCEEGPFFRLRIKKQWIEYGK